MNKQAMIMAAGLGTRLQEMTQSKPKALVEYKGKALLGHVIDKLQSFGYQDIVINIHHHAVMIKDWVAKQNYQGLQIQFSDESKLLLDTGGGLKEAASYFNAYPVLVYNVDILSSIDLDKFLEFHLENKSILSLAVKDRPTSRVLLSGNEDILCGWRNNLTGEEIITRSKIKTKAIAFSAVYFIEKEFILKMPDTVVFPVMPYILELSRTNPVKLYEHSQDSWSDMGKIESYKTNDIP